ncbi:MAG TPA: DNA repair protein RadA, partial [Magnetospirillaceae bacterium]|nr:DNA repair protein RadA [Magnetospirillaceae bacterium]
MNEKKKTLVYRCFACGRVEPRWLGRCPACGEWNSLREAAASASSAPGAAERRSLPLSAVDPAEGSRFLSGMAEVDRVLGGGVMKGSTILVGGEPGIGKSTLMLQVAARAGVRGRVLYVSGEESAPQIRLRADRLGLSREDLEVLCTGDLGIVLSALDQCRPRALVVDSLQTLRSEEAGAVPGTVNQVKYCALVLSEWARDAGAAVFLVAHVTKEGAIAGPKAAEHMVDAVLYFEQTDGDLRFLRAAKNRFGSTDEVGLFTMTETGLAEVSDPSRLFLTRREGGMPPGAAVAPLWEGSRCLLVEIQALTVPAKASLTRVYSDRVDAGRVARVAAVLERHAGLRFSDQDVYVNVAGGMRIAEPGADLAVAAALYSARSGLALPERTAVAGELSLAGEVRPLRRMRARVRACGALGFAEVIGPSQDEEGGENGWTGVATVQDAMRRIFGHR